MLTIINCALTITYLYPEVTSNSNTVESFFFSRAVDGGVGAVPTLALS